MKRDNALYAMVSGNEKSQSAMEYLMTYGWAILVIAIVMLALFEFGIFGGNTGGASGCLALSGYLCTSPLLTASGALSVTFGQFGTSTITIIGDNCSTTSTTPNIQAITPTSAASGEQVGLTFSCPISSNAIGTRFGGNLWVEYNTALQSGLVVEFANVHATVSEPASEQNVQCSNTVTSGYLNAPSVPFSGSVGYSLIGGGGGSGNDGVTGGSGSTSSGSFTVASGDSITVYVGGGGGAGREWGGGGGSGYYGGGGGGSSTSGAGGGGGSSAVLHNGALVAYAAGGAGGNGAGGNGGYGGGGGTNTGGAGGAGFESSPNAVGGNGGAQAGGAGGSGGGGGSGASGEGGSSGGGGGGYGGGGGGSGINTAGAGGSSGANGGNGDSGNGGIGSLNGGGGTGEGGDGGGNGGSATITWTSTTGVCTL